MPFVNLSSIPVPLRQKTTIDGTVVSKIDLQYMLPSRDSLVPTNIINNKEVKEFLELNSSILGRKEVNLKKVQICGYMPGLLVPRPRHKVYRITTKDQEGNKYSIVAKLVAPRGGIREAIKQDRILREGINTPEVLGLTDGIPILREEIDIWLSDFKEWIKNNERNGRLATEFRPILAVYSNLLDFTQEEILELRSNYQFRRILQRIDTKVKEIDINSSFLFQGFLKIIDKKVFSILWMTYIDSRKYNFERWAYHILTDEIELDKKKLSELIDLLSMLWKIDTHNDLKGEHIRLSEEGKWYLIDWGDYRIIGFLEGIAQDIVTLICNTTLYVLGRMRYDKRDIENTDNLNDFWIEILEKLRLNNRDGIFEKSLRVLDPIAKSLPIKNPIEWGKEILTSAN